MKKLLETWKVRNYPGEIVGMTPLFDTSLSRANGREAEIKYYLNNHPEIEEYVILDDYRMDLKNFIYVDPEFGLCWEVIAKAIQILNKN